MEERIKLMEPGKGFGVGIAFSTDKLAEIVKEYPVHVEKQYSGVRLSIQKDGEDIQMYLDDGTVITHRLPSFVAELSGEKWPGQLAIDCIAEMWLGNKVQSQEVLEEHLRQEKPLYEGEDKYVVLHVFDVMWMQDDIRGLTFGDRRDLLNVLPIVQSTEREPKTGKFNRVPSRICHGLESMINVVKNVSGAAGSRGAMIRTASSLYEEGKSSAWLRFDNIESYTVAILNKKQSRVAGMNNYCFGVELSDKFDIGTSDIITVDGKKFIFMGQIQSSRDLKIGDRIKLTAESVKLYGDKVRFHLPEMVKASKDEAMSLETIVEVAKDAGVFLKREVGASVWPKENEVNAVINSYMHGNSYSCYGLSIPMGKASEVWEFKLNEFPNEKRVMLSEGKKTILEYGDVLITPVEQVQLEFGTRKADFYEYFTTSLNMSGRLIFRKLDGEWKTWVMSNSIPYVLTLEAQTEGWVPPFGVSALPKAMREGVPERFRYWLEEDKEKRNVMRNTLRKARSIHFDVVKPLGKGVTLHLLKRKGHYYTGEGAITAGVYSVNMAEMDRITTADAKIGQFVLHKHWWRGEKLDDIGHYDLFIDDMQVVLSDDPREKPLQDRCECDECGEIFETEGNCMDATCPECGSTGARRFRKENAQLRKPYSKGFSKKGLKHAEMIEAKAPGNPSDYPSYVEQVDSGEVVAVVNEENFKRFNFKGKTIQGSYCLKKDGDDNAWKFWKEELAQGKKLELKPGETIVKHTVTLAVENIELESDTVAIVSGAALSFGVWNGDWYAPEVLDDRPERVLGIPYTVGDHSVRENHGKIIDFDYTDHTIRTKARVEGEQPVKDLKSGKFPGQSVEITVLSDEERHIIKRIISYDRLNAVDYPACVVCNVDNIEAE